MFCLLYNPKQKIVKFHAQKKIGKSHVIDMFTSEDMENISLCIFQYLTLYYIENNTWMRGNTRFISSVEHDISRVSAANE